MYEDLELNMVLLRSFAEKYCFQLKVILLRIKYKTRILFNLNLESKCYDTSNDKDTFGYLVSGFN